jgi:hypothetical protein
MPGQEAGSVPSLAAVGLDDGSEDEAFGGFVGADLPQKKGGQKATTESADSSTGDAQQDVQEFLAEWDLFLGTLGTSILNKTALVKLSGLLKKCQSKASMLATMSSPSLVDLKAEVSTLKDNMTSIQSVVKSVRAYKHTRSKKINAETEKAFVSALNELREKDLDTFHKLGDDILRSYLDVGTKVSLKAKQWDRIAFFLREDINALCMEAAELETLLRSRFAMCMDALLDSIGKDVAISSGRDVIARLLGQILSQSSESLHDQACNLELSCCNPRLIIDVWAKFDMLLGRIGHVPDATSQMVSSRACGSLHTAGARLTVLVGPCCMCVSQCSAGHGLWEIVLGSPAVCIGLASCILHRGLVAVQQSMLQASTGCRMQHAVVVSRFPEHQELHLIVSANTQAERERVFATFDFSSSRSFGECLGDAAGPCAGLSQGFPCGSKDDGPLLESSHG